MATFNLHGGVDAWGRPFDHVAAAALLEADVLLLQEAWTPDGGIGQAAEIAAAMGAPAHEAVLGRGRRAEPHPEATTTWHRRRARIDGDHGLFLESERPLSKRLASSERVAEAEPGRLASPSSARSPCAPRRSSSSPRCDAIGSGGASSSPSWTSTARRSRSSAPT